MKRSLFVLVLLCSMLLVGAIIPVHGQIDTTAYMIDATSNPATPTQPDGSSAIVAVGETVTLRMQFVLPESIAISLRVLADFGSSFNYVSGSARVSYLADTLPSLNGDFAGIQNQSEPNFTFPASRVNVTGSSGSFNFGSVINNDGDSGSENLIIEYDLVPSGSAVIGTAVNMTYNILIDEGLPTETIFPSSQITLNLVDPPGVTITPSGGSTDVTEGGATDTFTVVLNSEPNANVTITVNGDAQVGVSSVPPLPLVHVRQLEYASNGDSHGSE